MQTEHKVLRGDGLITEERSVKFKFTFEGSLIEISVDIPKGCHVARFLQAVWEARSLPPLSLPSAIDLCTRLLREHDHRLKENEAAKHHSPGRTPSPLQSDAVPIKEAKLSLAERRAKFIDVYRRLMADEGHSQTVLQVVQSYAVASGNISARRDQAMKQIEKQWREKRSGILASLKIGGKQNDAEVDENFKKQMIQTRDHWKKEAKELRKIQREDFQEFVLAQDEAGLFWDPDTSAPVDALQLWTVGAAPSVIQQKTVLSQETLRPGNRQLGKRFEVVVRHGDLANYVCPESPLSASPCFNPLIMASVYGSRLLAVLNPTVLGDSTEQSRHLQRACMSSSEFCFQDLHVQIEEMVRTLRQRGKELNHSGIRDMKDSKIKSENRTVSSSSTADSETEATDPPSPANSEATAAIDGKVVQQKSPETSDGNAPRQIAPSPKQSPALGPATNRQDHVQARKGDDIKPLLPPGAAFVTRHSNIFATHIVLHCIVQSCKPDTWAPPSTDALSRLTDALRHLFQKGVAGIAVPVFLSYTWPTNVNEKQLMETCNRVCRVLRSLCVDAAQGQTSCLHTIHLILPTGSPPEGVSVPRLVHHIKGAMEGQV